MILRATGCDPRPDTPSGNQAPAPDCENVATTRSPSNATAACRKAGGIKGCVAHGVMRISGDLTSCHIFETWGIVKQTLGKDVSVLSRRWAYAQTVHAHTQEKPNALNTQIYK